MTFYEYLDKFVDNNFNKQFSEEEQKLIEYFLAHKDEVNIDVHGYYPSEMKPLYDKAKNKEEIMENISKERFIKFTETGIFFRKVNTKLIDFINKYISKDVKSLTVPKKVFESLKLSEFHNLEEVTLDNKITITKELINKLKQSTKIKTINSYFEYDENDFKDALEIKSLINTMLLTNGVVIKNLTFKYSNYIDVFCKEPYSRLDDIFKILEGVDLDSIKGFDIREKGNTSYDGYFIKYGEETDYINNKTDKTLSFKSFKSISEIQDALKLFESKGAHFDKIRIEFENKDYDDIYAIKEIMNRYNCVFRYEGTNDEITFEEFIAMRETLDYYKNLILESNLSNLEKIMYAYDLIKSFEYKENEEDLNVSRHIHSIIRDGKIVCVGYATFLSQLLKEVGVDSFSISTTVPTKEGKMIGHQRNLVMVKDDKYGVDGLFAFDSTWDSAHNLVKVVTSDGEEAIRMRDKIEEGETIVKSYDDLVLYESFLIPYDSYQTAFPGEKMPNFENSKFHASAAASEQDIKDNFYSSKKIDFGLIIKVISNVKLKMGYSKEETLKAIKDVLEVHDLLNKKPEEEVVVKK